LLISVIPLGHSHDVTVFLAVKNWLDTCVQNPSHLDYGEMAEEREFWEEVPTIVEGLLRRV
jgi:ubiquitin carboxyl-terminal hydrolase 34